MGIHRPPSEMEGAMVAEPKPGEAWIENDSGAVFTIRAVDNWPSGKTVFAISAPSRRMTNSPIGTFMERFRKSGENDA